LIFTLNLVFVRALLLLQTKSFVFSSVSEV
jgi:hypothetical protein